MIWLIEYERKDYARSRVRTTFISKETETDLVIGRFEKMHRNRLTVIECKPRRKTETPEQKEARLSAFERDLLPVKKPTDGWKLIRVDDIEWTQDDSGVYVLINWDVQTESARLDIMPATSVPSDVLPIVSFAGRADNVRKAAMLWLSDNVKSNNGIISVSLEHAAYIGQQLEQADTERIDYVQDGKVSDTDTYGVTVVDVERWQEFKSVVPTVKAFADSDYYVSTCSDNGQSFLCAIGADNNIAVVNDLVQFANAIHFQI